jgi:hypothetical protein
MSRKEFPLQGVETFAIIEFFYSQFAKFVFQPSQMSLNPKRSEKRRNNKRAFWVGNGAALREREKI